MNARAIGLLLAGLCLGASGSVSSLAFAQNGSAQPPEMDANPIGKVITVTGSASIEHPAAILVQANLPASPAAMVSCSLTTSATFSL